MHTYNILHGVRISGLVHCITKSKNDMFSYWKNRSKVSVWSYFFVFSVNFRVIGIPCGVICSGRASILALMKYRVLCHGQTVKCWSFYISIIILKSEASSIIKILVSIGVQHEQQNQSRWRVLLLITSPHANQEYLLKKINCWSIKTIIITSFASEIYMLTHIQIV